LVVAVEILVGVFQNYPAHREVVVEDRQDRIHLPKVRRVEVALLRRIE
jgi:hypothetical protein